jgi:hypothetical protein
MPESSYSGLWHRSMGIAESGSVTVIAVPRAVCCQGCLSCSGCDASGTQVPEGRGLELECPACQPSA